MADEDNKTKTTEVEDTTQEAKEAGKEVTKLNKNISRLNNKPVERLANSMEKVTKTSIQTNKHFKKVSQEMQDSMSELEKVIGYAMTNNKKATLAAVVSLQSYYRQGEKAKDLLQETSGKLAESTKAFEDLTEGILKTRIRLAELSDQKEKNNGLTQEETKEVEKLTQTLVDQEHQYKQVAITVRDLTEASETYKQQLLDSTKQGLAEVEAIRMRNNELAVSAGGLGAITGQIRKTTDGRLFKFAQDILSGAAAATLFTISLAKLNKMLAEVGDYAKATGQISVSMGQAANLDFSDNFSKASDAAASMMSTAGSLGIKLEEVSEAANKIRLGLRADRDGTLSEEKIAGLTLEAAKFSKVAGVDMATSVDLLEKRTKRYGMSAAEAQADMQNMRVTLSQMAAGNKANAVSMAEMIDMIEEASSASQSYVVDTRLMTQALRGAVNQATLLGASQQEAKDIAKATGKVFSGAPDWVRIPAGHNLLNQLLGADSDKFIGRFNASTQKRLNSLRTAVRTGQTGAESASRELMDLLGSTEAGQEAQFKQMKNVLFEMGADGKKIIKRYEDAALVIKQEFGLDNMAQAGMLTRMMQDAAELQDMVYQDALKSGMNSKQAEDFANKSIPFSQALAKQTATFNDSIETALRKGENAVEVLKKQGASQKAAEEYVKFYQKKAGLEKKYQDEVKKVEENKSMSMLAKQRELRALQKQHFDEYTKEQNNLAQGIIDPVRKVMNEMGIDNESIKFDVKDFEKIGIKNAKELAERFGITGDKNIAELEKLYNSTNAEDRKIALERISAMRTADSEAAKDQEKFLTSFVTKLGDGVLPALGHVLNKFLGDMGFAGPALAAATAGLTAAIGGLALFYGPIALHKLIKGAVASGTEQGIKKAGGGGGGSSPTDLLDSSGKGNKGGRPKKGGKYTRRAKAIALVGRRKIGRLGKKIGGGLRGAAMMGLSFGGSALEAGGKLAPKVLETGGKLMPKVLETGGKLMPKAMEAGGKLLPKAANFLPKLLKTGLKASRAVPILGSLVSAGFLAKNAWDIGSDYFSGKGVKPSDLASAGLNVAGLIPGVGAAATAADFAADLTGGYDMLDSTVGPLGASPMTAPDAQALTGAATAMTVPQLSPFASAASDSALNPGATQIARAMRGQNGLASIGGELQAMPRIGGVAPDGSVTLRILNFLDILGDAKAIAARSNLRMS